MGRKRKKAKRMKDQWPAKPNQSGGEEKSTNRHVYIEPGARIDFVENLREQYEASQTKTATHNNKQLFWTKVGAGLILIYTFISAIQGCYTRQAANAATSAANTAQQTLIASN
jgi:hypothetical protein